MAFYNNVQELTKVCLSNNINNKHLYLPSDNNLIDNISQD